MALLAALALLAADPVLVTSADVGRRLEARDVPGALEVLRQLGTLKGNDTEAKGILAILRDSSPPKPPEVIEAGFLALQGIGSRAITRDLLVLLKTSPWKKEAAFRLGICRALEGSADPAGVEEILDLLKDTDDRVAAAAAEAAAVHRHAKESVRKELFEQVLNVYESTWNMKNSVDPAQKVEQRRAEKKFEVIEKPMEKALQLLSNITQNDPPSWRRWWNKNKNKPWPAVAG